MYLFTRSTRLAPSEFPEDDDLGSADDRKGEPGHRAQCSLVSTIFSPGVGTLAWTSTVEDLAVLEASDAKLMVDAGYLSLAEEGAKFASARESTTPLCDYWSLIRMQPTPSLVASSVFTHLDDPHQFIDATKPLLTDDGRVIIEVEYIGDIVRQIQFERFYLDRIFYYSLTSLKKLFERHAMEVVDVEHIEPHGGSLRVTIQQKNERNGAPAPSQRVGEQLQAEAEALTPARLEQFRREANEQIGAFREVLENYRKAGLRVAGYGAPARVSTICNYGNIGPSLIEYTVDDSELKQNKFTPGSHIPIVPRSHLLEHRPDVVVVFAYEYFDDIRSKTGGAYRYLVPIPPREVP